MEHRFIICSVEKLKVQGFQRELLINVLLERGPGSSVGIATGYGLDGLVIEAR